MPLTVNLVRTPPTDATATAVGAVEGQSEGHDLDWGHLAALGFEGKKGDVRAVPGAAGGTTWLLCDRSQGTSLRLASRLSSRCSSRRISRCRSGVMTMV